MREIEPSREGELEVDEGTGERSTLKVRVEDIELWWRRDPEKP
jgi:hypothetical protein